MNYAEVLSVIVLCIGVLAFTVSVITEVLKKWSWFDSHVPTALTVIVLSLILCPVATLAALYYYKQPIEWYMVFASFIAAFFVAMVSMDGWEHLTELGKRFVRKQ